VLWLNLMAVLVFTTSGTWTVPPGITSVTAECWGAGGGGKTTSGGGFGGGGGGGGAYAKGVVTVIPGNTYTVTVGVGGPSDADGTDSWFLSSATIDGGGGKTSGTAGAASGSALTASQAGGAGYTFPTGQGGNGGGGGAGSLGPGQPGHGSNGGAGGPANGGDGGDGALFGVDTVGFPGFFVGGGGGGGPKGVVSNGGGAGANGLVQLTYASPIPLEQKLRQEMLIDSGLSPLVGSNIFLVQLPSGFMSANPPVRALVIQRVSTLRYYTHDGATNPLIAARVQFTAWCKGSDSGNDALSVMAALVNFLNTFCATQTAEFGSPITTPTQFPNIVLNERMSVYPQTQPPLYQGILEARIFNREDL